jgi:AcrR family transcriptional regulator
MARTADARAPRPPDERRRRASSRAAILEATVALLEEVGYRGLTVEGVAQRAGVGKQTIYRWWGGSKAALVLEAFGDVGDRRVEPLDTGDVRADLLAVLAPVFDLHAGSLRRGTALANKTLMAEAQLDPGFHERYAALHAHWRGPLATAVARGVERGELAPETDPGTVVDLLLGGAWYRLLLEHAPLDPAAAVVLVDTVLDGCRDRSDDAGRARQRVASSRPSSTKEAARASGSSASTSSS